MHTKMQKTPKPWNEHRLKQCLRLFSSECSGTHMCLSKKGLTNILSVLAVNSPARNTTGATVPYLAEAIQEVPRKTTSFCK